VLVRVARQASRLTMESRRRRKVAKLLQPGVEEDGFSYPPPPPQNLTKLFILVIICQPFGAGRVHLVLWGGPSLSMIGQTRGRDLLVTSNLVRLPG